MRSTNAAIARGQDGCGDVLGRRALNRALLARQLLLQRWMLPVPDTIERLVGMQAQIPNAPYVGLWTRLDGFRPDDLAQLVTERRVVRLALMRSTIHLVTARDCLALRPVVQSVLDRDLYRNSTYGPGIAGMDMHALIAAGRALLDEQPRTPRELGVLLHSQWPGRDGAALAYAIRNQVPLIQVPPRGIWGMSGQTRCTTAEAWLGQTLAADSAPDAMILRYLAAFGPATVGDAQTWSGLTGLREAVERLRPRLRIFRDEHGRELFDLPDAPRPDPDTPAPPRFLPAYDNALLSHADRTRVIADDHRKIIAANRFTCGTVLVDGFACGTWTINRQAATATLAVSLFAALPVQDYAALGEEGARLLAFAAADASARDVQITLPE